MRNASRLVATFLAFTPVIAAGGSEPLDVRIADASITLATPSGFHEVSQVSPDIHRLAQTLTPRMNRLLAVYVTTDDLDRLRDRDEPELDRYLLVQTYRPTEHLNIGTDGFHKVTGQMKRQQESMMKNAKAMMDTELERASAQLSAEHAAAISLKVGEIFPLGVFAEGENSISMASLAKYEASANKERLEHLVAVAMNVLRVEDKIIFAYVYSTYDTKDDLDWVQSTSGDWIRQIYGADSQNTPVASSPRAETSTHEPSSGGFSMVMRGAVIVTFIALILFLFRQMARVFSGGKRR
ncbi:MAG: hypothetical protein ACE5LB_11455 [Acidiferrobacterales bacterium]